MTDSDTTRRAIVPEHLAGTRLDRALAEMFPEFSRSRLKDWVLQGRVLVDERQMRPKDPVGGSEEVEVRPLIETVTHAAAQPIPLSWVYDDEHLIVVNKPPGLVVHPGAGNPDRTLVNALLHQDPSLECLPRAGLVHRLDKDTSGLLLVARSIEGQTRLTQALQAREIRREYEAVVVGALTGGGVIDQPIGRHPVHRTRMAIRPGGRPSRTHYRLATRFRRHTHLRLQLETGRTHQIRVHLSHLRHPIVGDPIYGGRSVVPPGASAELIALLQSFPRQALHAAALSLQHPVSGEEMSWEAPLPEDMLGLLAALQADTEANPA